MKIMKHIIKELSLTALLLLFFISCDEGGNPDPGGTTVEKLAGDWFVQYKQNGKAVTDYNLLSTYNTSANNGLIWLDDASQKLKVRVKTEVSKLSFSIKDVPNQFKGKYNKITITDGKVLEKQATTTGGNVSDSIYFQIQFSDDPGNTYAVEGYRRTGFAPDEH